MDVMNSNENPRVARIAEDEPTAQRQRLPWHAPQLIKATTVQRLTGSHRASTGADVNTNISGVS
jgi:hypothetical protein